VQLSSADFRLEDRFHRQSLIEWWEQDRLARANILVIGAGALGNEVLKNLALLGAGRVLVYDMDRIDRSNLSRAVLFREGDEGEAKAEVAARRMRELHAGTTVVARNENVAHRGGLGVFAWADVVLACVDSREARIFINSACARTGRVWIDGAIEALSCVVRVFDPARGACYECTMNGIDRRLVAERRSCAMLARDIVAQGHVPSTAVAAAICGAIEVQEAIKLLHGQPALVGAGLHIDGMWNEVSRVSYPRREECAGHETSGPIEALGLGVRDASFRNLLARAEAELGTGAVIDLSRDVVTGLTCPDCGAHETAGAAVGAIGEREARCAACGVHRVVEIISSVDAGGGTVSLDRTPADVGVPPFDVVVARRGIEEQRAWLFDGDADEILGPLGGR
jgi:adenylyltransferase/sulfurtransferase